MAELLFDFLSRDFKPQPAIIGRGLLPIKSKCIIGGAPKVGKSFIALNVALSITRGRPLFDAYYNNSTPVFPVSKTHRVLYLEQEVGDYDLRNRLNSILGGELDPGIELFIKSRDLQLRLDTDEGRRLIAAEVAEVKPDVVIFDPLAKFHLQDENSAQWMGAIMRAGDRLIEEYGCALIYIHHIGKPGGEENAKRGGDRLRGSSAVFADVDTLILVDRQSASNVREPVLKLEMELRRGEPIENIYLKRDRRGICEYIGEKPPSGRAAKPSPDLPAPSVVSEFPAPAKGTEGL